MIRGKRSNHYLCGGPVVSVSCSIAAVTRRPDSRTSVIAVCRKPVAIRFGLVGVHNVKPKPFVWTKSAEAILAKLDPCPVPSV